jgi:hypothetical protein
MKDLDPLTPEVAGAAQRFLEGGRAPKTPYGVFRERYAAALDFLEERALAVEACRT